MLQEIAKELTTKKEIVLDKAGVLLYITYENDKFCMTQYNNVSFSSKEDFLNNINKLTPDDIGMYAGDNDVETAEKAVLDFLNLYCKSMIDEVCIYF